jgi:chemotaxis signal transduction protein
MMVCRVGPRRVGVLVDAVLQVRRVPRAALRPAPLGTPHVLGVTGEGQQVTILLDVKALLAEEGP